MDKLAEAIERFYGEKNNENLNLVVQEIMKTKLIAPVQVDVTGLSNIDKLNQGGPVQPHKDMQIKLLNLSREGKNFFPVFSGKEQMEKAPQSSTLEVGLKTYEKAVNDPNIEGILVNPFTKSFFINKELLAAMLNALAGKPQQPQQQQKNVKVSFFDPNPYPTEMVYGARLVLMCQTNVKSAYILCMKNEDTQQISYLFIVKFDDGVEQKDVKAVFDSMNKEVQSYKPAFPISFMINNNPLAQKATENKKPFFRRYDDDEYEAEKSGDTAVEDTPSAEEINTANENDAAAEGDNTAKENTSSAVNENADNESINSPVHEDAENEAVPSASENPHTTQINEASENVSEEKKKSWFKKIFKKGDNK